ncbi:unnamed protein product, partial [marine sediment metagenome]
MTTTYNFRPRKSLTGGVAGSLDNLNGSILINGDGTVVIASDYIYAYILNATSGAEENSPDIIAPDRNTGDKRHIRKKFYVVHDELIG